MPQRHMDRLTSFDTSFLANEKANGHMAIGAVLVCDGPAPSLEDLVTHVRSRLHLLPRLRQRLCFPPLRLGTPFWVDDPEFEIATHVRGASLPAPGTTAQFRELAGELLAPPLDRSRPLWELWLIDGFEEDRFGVVYKTHHAMADGISAVDIGTLLFDTEPRREPAREVASWHPQSPPTNAHLAAAAVRGLWATLRRAARWLRHALRDPRGAARRAGDGAAGLREVGWALTKPAPRVPFNVEIGPRRCFCWVGAGLDDFKRIKDTLGGTVNDVSLAVSAGALRRWLGDRGVATDGLELRALVPVSIRTEDEHGQLGNRLTAMRGPLPVHVADPVERLREVAAAMDGLKASKQPLGAQAIWGLNDWFRDFAPPLLLAPTASLNFSIRLFNLLVTNFPGPQVPLYVLGRELTGVYPVGFLARRHALAIAIISYNGRVNFGLIADPDSIGDLERIAAHIDDEVAALLAAVEPTVEARGG
jgi:diacylglycerol O-acyltransferase